MLTPSPAPDDNQVVEVGPAVRSRSSWRPTHSWWVEMGRFLAIGGVAFVVDFGLFNLLAYGPGQLLGHKQVTAKIIATVVATLVSWVGNRHWTFADHRTSRRGRELVIYGVINAVAALVPSGTLYVALYWLGLHGQLVANAAAVIGTAIGTAVRYVGYKLWVFTGSRLAPAGD